MNNKSEIKLFEEKNVRTVWDADKEVWFISVIDVIEVLTGTYRPRKYWNDLKTKLTREGSEVSEKIGQLKNAYTGRQDAADGCRRPGTGIETYSIHPIFKSGTI